MQFYSTLLQWKKGFHHDSGRTLKQAIVGLCKVSIPGDTQESESTWSWATCWRKIYLRNWGMLEEMTGLSPEVLFILSEPVNEILFTSLLFYLGYNLKFKSIL